MPGLLDILTQATSGATPGLLGNVGVQQGKPSGILGDFGATPNQRVADAFAQMPPEMMRGMGFAQPSSQAPDENFSAAVSAVGQKYPVLAPHLKNTAVSYGQPNGPNDNRQLEFYSPGEPDNPTPGKIHVQIFNKDLKGDDLGNSIAGDMLHHLGGVDPTNGKPIDPAFYALKRELGAARGPMHQRIDRDAYERDLAAPYGAGEYGDWDQRSRLDAYVRAGLFPEQNPDWYRSDDFFNPQMHGVFDKMRSYLTKPTSTQQPSSGQLPPGLAQLLLGMMSPQGQQIPPMNGQAPQMAQTSYGQR